VRDEQWRYIRYANGDEELYNHSNDPNEWTNLASRTEFAARKSELARFFPATNRPPVTTRARVGEENNGVNRLPRGTRRAATDRP
jgi:hypothetical protein